MTASEILIAVVYVIGFVLTFGHAYARYIKGDAIRYGRRSDAAGGAFTAALFWPLYLATFLFR